MTLAGKGATHLTSFASNRPDSASGAEPAGHTLARYSQNPFHMASALGATGAGACAAAPSSGATTGASCGCVRSRSLSALTHATNVSWSCVLPLAPIISYRYGAFCANHWLEIDCLQSARVLSYSNNDSGKN
eukprot:TRINITY_DN2854_c0_g1_i2.p2 TRINITY_DN2854_c0_g1~~TRINITY_DN2854_c0_g1_i2.p2  ORF type:complete len:132 (+),score=0.98 TRINITY_DN2854_c0_g1_i2:44-439(+)